MKKTNSTINISGLFETLLAVAFIVLKLCHVINWSWIWVLAPIWMPIVIGLIIILIVSLVLAS